MQPLRAFDLDAGIIFADILTILEGLGLHLEFVKGDGPVIHNPIRSAANVEALRVRPAEETLDFTLQAIRQVKADHAGSSVSNRRCTPFTKFRRASFVPTSQREHSINRFLSWNQKLPPNSLNNACFVRPRLWPLLGFLFPLLANRFSRLLKIVTDVRKHRAL